VLKDREKVSRHDQTFWSVRSKHDIVDEQLPEWEDLRDHASDIKRHTITHLADYLEQFSCQLESRGVIVHWAKDAKELNEIVYGILETHKVRKMVKSKSMLTEECGLNDYLQERDIDVVETDLGERILQLMHKAPAHIVMPAIHITREEVGKMFEEKGISDETGNYDPTFLTLLCPQEPARRVSTGRGGTDGLQLRRGRDRRHRGVYQRGQCRHDNLDAQAAHRDDGHREAGARLPQSGRLPATAVPLRHGAAHHYLHLALPPGKAGWRDARGAARQWAQQHRG
jgi:hypothetical protein